MFPLITILALLSRFFNRLSVESCPICTCYLGLSFSVGVVPKLVVGFSCFVVVSLVLLSSHSIFHDVVYYPLCECSQGGLPRYMYDPALELHSLQVQHSLRKALRVLDVEADAAPLDGIAMDIDQYRFDEEFRYSRGSRMSTTSRLTSFLRGAHYP